MKKLLLTAFIFMLGMHGAQAVEMPSCGMLHAKLDEALFGIQSEADRQRAKNTVLAQLQKGPEGDIFLGVMSVCGVLVPKDVPKGIRLLEDGVRAGKVNSFLMLYVAYSGFFDEEQVPRDQHKAQQFLTEIGRTGTGEMQFILGQAYHDGEIQLGIPQNRAKAAQLWTRAASQGWVEAYSRLGTLYMEDQNYEAARKWLELGCAAGDSDSKRQWAVLQTKVSQ